MNSSTSRTGTVLGLVMVGCLALLPAGRAAASGGTTHLTVSELAIGKVSPDLAKLLKANKDPYRNGTLHPDIMYKVLPDNEKEAGHFFVGDKKNWVNNMLADMKATCGSTSKCARRIAFVMGALSHMVEDGRFDRQFVGKYGVAGGVTSNCGVSPPSNRFDDGTAENFTDTDLDICLSKSIAKVVNITNVNLVPATQAPNAGAICPAGQFLDLGTWKCWSCPAGYVRTLAPITASNACYQPASNQCGAATFIRNNTYAGQGCPSGDFWDFMGQNGQDSWMGSCWSCNGWTRSGTPVNSGNACCKGVPASSSAATEGNSPGCPAGTFLDPTVAGCWSCPSGYSRTLLYKVNGARACERDVDECAKAVNLPTLSASPTPASMYIPADIYAAYQGDDITVNPLELNKFTLGAFGLFKVELFATNDSFTNIGGSMPYAKSVFYCDWGLANFATASGGINDSTDTVTKFLDAAWVAIGQYFEGTDIKFVRTSTSYYSIEKNGVAYYTQN